MIVIQIQRWRPGKHNNNQLNILIIYLELCIILSITGGGGEHNNNEQRHHQQHQYHQPAGLRGIHDDGDDH